MDRLIFDAFAVVAWLRGEAGVELVRALLEDVRRGDIWGGICTVNLGEVFYTLAREHGHHQAEQWLEYLLQLDWDVLPASDDLVWTAARLKARFPISYADAFALACARDQEADLVTGDPELLAAPHGVTVRWIREA